MNEEEKEAIEETKQVIEKWNDTNWVISYDHKNLEIILNYINKLQKEIEREQKLTNLIIDDFQAENYFINMTNKEVREFYNRRKELK